MSDDFPGLARFQSVKQVDAGEITEVVEAGCYVRTKTGDAVLLTYQPGMTARYRPKVGDYWVIYRPDGYASISPGDVFVDGYKPVAA